MTLPASFPLSMSQIATELGLSLPLSLSHAWVEALANKTGLPVKFSDLLGKTGRFDGNITCSGGTSPLLGNPFFNSTLDQLSFLGGTVGLTYSGIAPSYTGNIKLINNTNSVSAVLAFNGAIGFTGWYNSSPPANIVNQNGTNNYTILPSI